MGNQRGNSEVVWIHPKHDGSIIFTYTFFCFLSSRKTLGLSVCSQTSVYTHTGGRMVGGELGENLVECAEEEGKSLVICQISNTQSDLKSCAPPFTAHLIWPCLTIYMWLKKLEAATMTQTVTGTIFKLSLLHDLPAPSPLLQSATCFLTTLTSSCLYSFPSLLSLSCSSSSSS